MNSPFDCECSPAGFKICPHLPARYNMFFEQLRACWMANGVPKKNSDESSASAASLGSPSSYNNTSFLRLSTQSRSTVPAYKYPVPAQDWLTCISRTDLNGWLSSNELTLPERDLAALLKFLPVNFDNCFPWRFLSSELVKKIKGTFFSAVTLMQLTDLRGYYTLSNILKYLSWEEIGRLMIATNGYLKPYLDDHPEVTSVVFSKQNNADFLHPVLWGNSFRDVQRVQLTINTLDTYANVLKDMQVPEDLLKWRIEMTTEHMLCEEPPCIFKVSSSLREPTNCFVSFNPVFNLVAACTQSNELKIFRLTGAKRFSEGSQIFQLKLNSGAYVFKDDQYNIVQLTWCPSGEFLLLFMAPLKTFNLTDLNLGQNLFNEGKNLASVLIFHYESEKELFKHIIFGEDSLRMDICMTSHSPWLSNNQFLVAAPENHTGLHLITIECPPNQAPTVKTERFLKDAHRPTQGIQSDVQYLNPTNKRQNEASGQTKRLNLSSARTHKYVGAYFGLGYEPKYGHVYGCLTNCPWLHHHSRILIQNHQSEQDTELPGLLRATLAVIEIPGHLMTFTVKDGTLWLVYLYLVDGSEAEVNIIKDCNLLVPDESNYEKILLSCNLSENQPSGSKLNLLNRYQTQNPGECRGRLGIAKFDFHNLTVKNFNRFPSFSPLFEFHPHMHGQGFVDTLNPLAVRAYLAQMCLISDVDVTKSCLFYRNGCFMNPEGIYQVGLEDHKHYWTGHSSSEPRNYARSNIHDQGYMVRHHPNKPLVATVRENFIKIYLKPSATYLEEVELFPPERRRDKLNFRLYSAPIKVVRSLRNPTWSERFGGDVGGSDFDPNYLDEFESHFADDLDSCKLTM